MASEVHPWRFELEIFPSRLPCGHVFEPKLNAQQGAICGAFFLYFLNALSRAHRGVLLPTSLWLGPIDSLPFATVVFWLHFRRKEKKVLSIHCHLPLSFSGFILGGGGKKKKKKKTFLKEKHGKKTPLSTFHSNQLQHTRSACFKTDLPDHFRFNFVQVVTEPCWSVVLLWRHGGHVTENGIFSWDDADARSVVFVFIQINTFTYLRKMSIYQTNSVYVKLYLYSTK